MKLIFSFVLSFAFLASQAGDSSFVINGKFEKAKSGMIYLGYNYNGNYIKDSVRIERGKFSFRGHVAEPVMASLTRNNTRDDYFQFYIEPKKFNITGDGDSLKLLKVSGSEVNTDDRKLKALMSGILAWEETNGNLYDAALKEKNKPMLDSLDEVDIALLKAKQKLVTDFVRQNPNSPSGRLSHT